MRNKMISGLAATAVALAVFATPAPVLAGGSFGAVVEQVLLSQKDGRVGKLTADKKRELVSCVNTVLAKLPAGKKRYVTEAASFDEQQDRFGEVVLENRAEWKQKIAKSCAKIALA
jgi:hypothetical protein